MKLLAQTFVGLVLLFVAAYAPIEPPQSNCCGCFAMGIFFACIFDLWPTEQTQ